ncbi:hypothetical protein K438DRAFT_1781238 [Mycena galopus ATCC 62051]|nr:hypothetical protein K438DRAFT_1781238 [Mycena galopus ATCC 62051]
MSTNTSSSNSTGAEAVPPLVCANEKHECGNDYLESVECTQDVHQRGPDVLAEKPVQGDDFGEEELDGKKIYAGEEEEGLGPQVELARRWRDPFAGKRGNGSAVFERYGSSDANATEGCGDGGGPSRLGVVPFDNDGRKIGKDEDDASCGVSERLDGGESRKQRRLDITTGTSDRLECGCEAATKITNLKFRISDLKMAMK